MTPQPEIPHPCRDDLWRQLSHAVTFRTGGDQVVWTVCSVFAAAHACVDRALPNGNLPHKQAGFTVATAGVALAVTWYAIHERVLGHLDRYEDVVRRLEDARKIDSTFRLTNLFPCRDSPEDLST